MQLFYPCRSSPRAEYRRAHPDKRRALLHRGLVVLGHPHRELGGLDAGGVYLSQKPPHPHEVRPGALRVVRERRDAHQPPEPDVPERRHFARERKRILRPDAVLRRLARYVYLEQYVLDDAPLRRLPVYLAR